MIGCRRHACQQNMWLLVVRGPIQGVALIPEDAQIQDRRDLGIKRFLMRVRRKGNSHRTEKRKSVECFGIWI
jgi:predicted acetyltransferase